MNSTSINVTFVTTTKAMNPIPEIPAMPKTLRFLRRTNCRIFATMAGIAFFTCQTVELLAQATFYPMASGNYSQGFTNIADWTNNYASGVGSQNWRVATSVATSTGTNFTVFSASTSGGVQKGSESIVFLATGTNAGATDLLLDFSGRVATSMSFDYSKIANSANDATPRSSDLKVQYSLDNGLTFADLTGYAIPRINNNSTPQSGTLNITLPAELSDKPQVLLRFYFWNNGQTTGSGNRPKWSVDNILVSSTALGGDTAPPVITALTPTNNALNVPITTNLVAVLNESVVKGTGNVTVKLASNDDVLATIPVADAAVAVTGTTVTVTLPSSLAPSTAYYVNIDAGAFADASGNGFAGIIDKSTWTFTTEAPDTTGPVPTAFVPSNGAANFRIDPEEIMITFNEPVSYIGTSPIELRSVAGDVLVAQFDSENSFADVTEPNVLTVFLLEPLALDYGTAYYISVPAGTVEDSLGNDNLAFGAPASSNPWTFTTLPEPTPPSVVVNKYANIGGGATDFIELLVIGNQTPGSTLDMRGMIVKDFSSSMSGDSGGKFEFADNPLWQSVPVGTLIVLNGGTTSSDTNAADFKIAAGLGDTALFVSSSVSSFDIATTEMIMIKAAGSGTAGVTGGIHALAAGTAGTLFNDFLGPKLRASATTGTGRAVIANNSNSILADYNGIDATDAAAAEIVFGTANSPANATYISQLRGLTPGDGDGSVVLANVTPGSAFSGTPVFSPGLTGQSVSLTLNATIPAISLASISIEVPTDFGTPGGVALSGPAAASALSSITGQTVTVTGAAATVSQPLVITISGLQAPVPGVGDFGNRSFVVATSAAGGTLTAIGSSPLALVTIPISKLRETNVSGVPLALGQQAAVAGVVTEENFSTTNIQATVQDATAGISLFNAASTISPFLRGTRYLLYGPVSQFNGLTQLNYAGFIDLGADSQPTPLVLTIPTLNAAAEAYEGSLITIENLSYVSGTWAAAQTVELKDASDNKINIRIQAGSTATTLPEFPVNVTGILGQFDSSSPFTLGYQLQPRDMQDLAPAAPPGNTLATWIGGFQVGGQIGFNDDFDKDGLSNALENILGSDPSASNRGISLLSASAGNLVFRHTLNATPASDLAASYEWSTNLANWNASGASAGGTTVTFSAPVEIAAGPPALVEVTATVSGTPSAKVFTRLKVTQAP